ncbi:MAG: hypothetical protein ACLTFJ_02880 [Clostridium sp.]
MNTAIGEGKGCFDKSVERNTVSAFFTVSGEKNGVMVPGLRAVLTQKLRVRVKYERDCKIGKKSGVLLESAKLREIF